jgi:outer membrane protein assembly factor BamB
MTDIRPEPRNATVQFPGGIRARWRWAGSGRGAEVFALTEAGGELTDHGPLVAPDPDVLCRAELRIDGPGGAWTARFASTIFDDPTAVFVDTAGLLAVGYGFHTYGLEARTGALRWSHRSATPLVGLFASSRLAHVVVQAEIETFAIEADGTVAWRVAHSDVVTAAELVGGRLVLTSFGGELMALDPATGRPTG